MDEIKQSGDTTSIPIVKPTMRGHIDDQGVLYATVESIVDEMFDEEMDTYDFIVHTYSGDMVNVRLKENHIQQMVLYMRKEQADLRHLKHIMKN